MGGVHPVAALDPTRSFREFHKVPMRRTQSGKEYWQINKKKNCTTLHCAKMFYTWMFSTHSCDVLFSWGCWSLPGEFWFPSEVRLLNRFPESIKWWADVFCASVLEMRHTQTHTHTCVILVLFKRLLKHSFFSPLLLHFYSPRKVETSQSFTISSIQQFLFPTFFFLKSIPRRTRSLTATIPSIRLALKKWPARSKVRQA